MTFFELQICTGQQQRGRQIDQFYVTMGARFDARRTALLLKDERTQLVAAHGAWEVMRIFHARRGPLSYTIRFCSFCSSESPLSQACDPISCKHT